MTFFSVALPALGLKLLSLDAYVQMKGEGFKLSEASVWRYSTWVFDSTLKRDRGDQGWSRTTIVDALPGALHWRGGKQDKT